MAVLVPELAYQAIDLCSDSLGIVTSFVDDLLGDKLLVNMLCERNDFRVFCAVPFELVCYDASTRRAFYYRRKTLK